MCCCGKPTINGERGYRWQPKDTPSVYTPHPPTPESNDELIYDEPGRCGGLDSHSHHLRLVKKYGSHYLLVKHGGGEERIKLSCAAGLFIPAMQAMDTNARYWLLLTLYDAHGDAATEAADKCEAKWRKAAAEKRIKTRKYPARGTVKVWIEPTASAAV